jgi:hypothetical protein
MSGPIITGSPNDKSGNINQARLTDLTIGWCGHPGRIVTASPNCKANNLGKARISDQVTGCNIGVIVTGLPTHQVNSACSDDGRPPTPGPPWPVLFQGDVITYTEVDFGNLDDEVDTDDGLNIFPPVVGRPPTPEEIQRSNDLDVSPTQTIQVDSTAAVPTSTPPTACIDVEDPVPNNFVLSPNFTAGQLSTQTAISNYYIRAQVGLTVEDIVCNLQAWAENIGEPLSSKYGRSNILVTSGFRHGTGTSQHNRGQAVDFQFPNKTNTEVYQVAVWIRDNLNYDQLILEYGGNRPWIHCSFNRDGNRPHTQFNKFGTRVSPGNYVWGELRDMQ